MDSRRIDSLAKSFAEGRSRRTVVRGIAGALIGGLAVRASVGSTEAAVCRDPGGTCRENANCCTGLCDTVYRGRLFCSDCADGSAYCSKTKTCVPNTVTSTIEVTKRDSNSGLRVIGSCFQVYRDNNFVASSCDSSNSDGDDSMTAISGLPAGSYSLVESTKWGDCAAASPKPFTIDACDAGKTISLTFTASCNCYDDNCFE